MGVFTLSVEKDHVPQNGIRVLIRKDGKIVGSDITHDGKVSFKVLHREYDCIVQGRNQVITTFHVAFDASCDKIVLAL